MPRFYVTTPAFYINYEPSVGSAYPVVIADILARWHRLNGNDVFFLTGLDENSIKTVQAAKEKEEEDIQKYADEMASKWKKAWKVLGISNDYFIRTTEEKHKKNVERFFKLVHDKGDIYKGRYEGLYCEGCEAYLTESELVDGRCPLHKTVPKQLSEENYFFRLSKYQDMILKHIEENPHFIHPKSRKNEIVNFVKGGLKDISVSRPGLEWGIPLPIDKKHVVWVWFDALVNYLLPEKYWPADIHVIGKDIARFHCVIWIGMLLSAGYPLPKKIFAHGFFTVNGQKMSKSLGNVIDPLYLADKYSPDALRYFLLRGIPFGGDGDFSERGLRDSLNNELIATLGNFIHRALVFINKIGGRIPEPKELSESDKGMISLTTKSKEKMGKLVEQLKLREAQEEIVLLAGAFNKYLSAREPWKEKDQTRRENTIYVCSRAISALAILMRPFLPFTSDSLMSMVGMEKEKVGWDDADKELIPPGHGIGKIKPLFEKISDEQIKKQEEKLKG